MHQYATLEDTVYLWFGANDTSGSGADGATAVYDVREGGATSSAAPTLSGSATLLSHANYPAGAYEVAIAATAANGFAADKTYGVFCTLAVDTQNPTGFIGGFSLFGVPSNVKKFGGTAVTGRDIGASVLLSSGTGAGQVSLSSGAVTAGTVSDKTGYSLTQTFPTNFSSLSIDSGGSVKVQSGIKKNVALPDFQFLMTDSTNDEPAASLTVSVTISKDGGAFASATNAVAEVGNGVYGIDITQTEMNADKVTVRATASGANDTFVTLFTDP